MTTSASVSYTHLDVYKRQGLCWKGKLLLLEQGMLFLYVGGQQVLYEQEKEADPVSYTHLRLR